MPTNITINTVDTPAVVYLHDGNSVVIEPGKEQGFQLVNGSFCTISEAVSHDEDEHQPPGTALAERMIEYWDDMRAAFRKVAQQRTAQPLDPEEAALDAKTGYSEERAAAD